MKQSSFCVFFLTFVFLLQLARASQADHNYLDQFFFDTEPICTVNMTSRLAPVIALSHGGG